MSTDTTGGTSRGTTDGSNQSAANSSRTQTNVAPLYSTAGLLTTTGAVGALIWLQSRPRKEAAEAAQAWLRARRHQLEEDLALGAGPAIDDLASLAHVRPEHANRFGRLLRDRRVEVLALADTGRLTPDRAVTLLRSVGGWMLADAELGPGARQAQFAAAREAEPELHRQAPVEADNTASEPSAK